MRYIDVDKLKENLADRLKTPYFMDVADFLDEAPAEDVAPVKHGKYIWACSVCHTEVGSEGKPPKFRYCPNCGAKMEEN